MQAKARYKHIFVYSSESGLKMFDCLVYVHKRVSGSHRSFLNQISENYKWLTQDFILFCALQNCPQLWKRLHYYLQLWLIPQLLLTILKFPSVIWYKISLVKNIWSNRTFFKLERIANFRSSYTYAFEKSLRKHFCALFRLINISRYLKNLLLHADSIQAN